MKLIFPHYYLEAQDHEEGKRVKIVSENQLEHVIKLCNMYAKSVRSLNDHNLSAYKGLNILIDYRDFNQIKKINANTRKAKLEPGTTFTQLNSQLAHHNFYVPYVVPNLGENADDIQLDQAVQENRLCIQSLKYGTFKDYALERVSFVSGEGRMIQTGGYKVKDTFSFGFNMNDLFAGSHYTLGLLFEVVVNLIKQQPNTKGKEYRLEIKNGQKQLAQILANFKEYVQMKEEKEQSLVDGIVITNFKDLSNIEVIAFDFSLTHQTSITDFKTKCQHKVSNITESKIIDQTLDSNFVSHFAYSSSQGIDNEITMVLPLESGFSFFEDYRETFETFPFQMHFLKRYIVIKLCFNSQDQEQLITLDRITSQVIKKGGTLRGSRKVLYMISPYLDKRIIGNYNMKIHNQVKQVFDPKDVLNPSAFFYLREKYEKSVMQKMKDKNKQINYIFSR